MAHDGRTVHIKLSHFNGLLPSDGMHPSGQPFLSTDNHYRFQTHPCGIKAQDEIGLLSHGWNLQNNSVSLHAVILQQPGPVKLQTAWTCEAFVLPYSATVRTAEPRS